VSLKLCFVLNGKNCQLVFMISRVYLTKEEVTFKYLLIFVWSDETTQKNQKILIQ